MGSATGFETLEEETRIDSLPVEGAMPAWLSGSLLRTGPAKFDVGKREMNHWFDGFAMLHRFHFAGGAVSYANRFLEGQAYRAADETGEITYSEFATDPCRSLFKRAMAMFRPALSDNANVNLVQLGERFAAMTETPIAVEFDAETLAAAGVAWEVPGMLTTAHPHLDRGSGGMLNYAAKLGIRNQYRFFRLGAAAGAAPDVVASLPTREPAYMHSFGLAERWIVLAEFPYRVNTAALAMSGRPYIENYRWKPELGTRFTLIERNGGEVLGPFAAEACFGFHHVNAFEDDGGKIVADICTFDDAAIVSSLYLDNLRSGGSIPPPALSRFTISPTTGSVAVERLIEEPIDLPRIDYGRCNERPYRYVWGIGTDGTGFFDRIVRADLDERSSLTWSEPDCWPGEPVFVARPDARGEGDGVLLSLVLDGAAATSFLLVLDATTLAEVGRARVPHHIPFGFHGQYAAA
ncbi:MAG TPA: carotenoid oxygenase family protein [Solirubrobacterales bacterium]|nr:carotenoid oxygenase family protein [Solirubrobacterales bacterium]